MKNTLLVSLEQELSEVELELQKLRGIADRVRELKDRGMRLHNTISSLKFADKLASAELKEFGEDYCLFKFNNSDVKGAENEQT